MNQRYTITIEAEPGDTRPIGIRLRQWLKIGSKGFHFRAVEVAEVDPPSVDRRMDGIAAGTSIRDAITRRFPTLAERLRGEGPTLESVMRDKRQRASGADTGASGEGATG